MTTETPTLAPVLQSRIDALRDICRRRHVRQLDAFGDVTNGKFDPETSEIELLVDILPLPWGQIFHNFMDMKHDVDELFGCDVGLVEDGAPIFENPYFRARVKRTRVKIFEARDTDRSSPAESR